MICPWRCASIAYYPIHLITINGNGFNRGKGLNIAAQHANGNILFFLDADMIVCREVIERGITEVTMNNVFYPIPWYYTNEEHTQGNYNSGIGNMFISTELFKKVGPWPEYNGWGFEDLDLYKKIKESNITIKTQEQSYFTHQWHPQTKEFKNQYAIEDKPLIDERRSHYQDAYDLEQIILKRDIEQMLGQSLANTNKGL